MRRGTNITPVGLATLDVAIYGPGEYRNASIRQRRKAQQKNSRISLALIGKIRQLAALDWTTHRIANHLNVAEVTVDRYRKRRVEKQGKCERCGREMMLPCRACEIESGITREARILFSQGE